MVAEVSQRGDEILAQGVSGLWRAGGAAVAADDCRGQSIAQLDHNTFGGLLAHAGDAGEAGDITTLEDLNVLTSLAAQHDEE